MMVRRIDPQVLDTDRPPDPTPNLEGWLGAVTRLLRLSGPEREAIHDELSGHLQERVHDLMIGGATEEEAIRVALTELGEAADLARRFRHAHRFRFRRIAMNLSCIGLGLTAIGLGVVAVKSGAPRSEHVRISMFEEFAETQEPEQLGVVLSVAFEETPLQEVFEYVSASTGLAIHPHWRELANYGIDHEFMVTMRIENLPLNRLLDMICAEVSEDDDLAWRAADEVIEFGLLDTFLRRELTLVSYDISEVVLALGDEFALSYDDVTAQITDLIYQLVTPDHWTTNGGDLAQIHVIGGKMFVQAPVSTHQPIAWILDELAQDAEHGAAPGGAGGGGLSATRGGAGAPGGSGMGAPGAAGGGGRMGGPRPGN
jgi:hypothetical protein